MNLCWCVSRHLESRRHKRKLNLEDELDVVSGAGEQWMNPTGTQCTRQVDLKHSYDNQNPLTCIYCVLRHNVLIECNFRTLL